MSESYGLVLPFDTDSAEFARGFECGRVWHAMEQGVPHIAQTMHASNAEMVMRMADAQGYEFTAADLDETFVGVELQREADRG